METRTIPDDPVVNPLNTRLLAVLRALPDLPAKPALSADSKGGSDYFKLRFPAVGEEGEASSRQTIYVGKLTSAEEALLREEIEFLWPKDYLPERWQYLDDLRARVRSLKNTASALAPRCGAYFQGYRLVITPDSRLSEPRDLESLVLLHDLLIEIAKIQMAIVGERESVAKDMSDSQATAYGKWHKRFNARGASLYDQMERTQHALERVEELFEQMGASDEDRRG